MGDISVTVVGIVVFRDERVCPRFLNILAWKLQHPPTPRKFLEVENALNTQRIRS